MENLSAIIRIITNLMVIIMIQKVINSNGKNNDNEINKYNYSNDNINDSNDNK